MSEEQNNIDQNGIQQTEGMDTQESQGGEGAENEDERCEKFAFTQMENILIQLAQQCLNKARTYGTAV